MFDISRWKVVSFLPVAVAGFVATAYVPTAALASSTVKVPITFYGYPDNDPPGRAISYPRSDGYPTVHNQASGSGTYSDPVTVAARTGAYRVGTKLYISGLRRYGVVEDPCASCTGSWIDVWVGGTSTTKQAMLRCEDALTPDYRVSVEVSPPAGRPVNAGSLFIAPNTCYRTHF